MDPTIILSNGTDITYTDIDVSSIVGVGTVVVSLRIVEKSGILGTQVWIRRKGDVTEITPYRLIDNGSQFIETSVDSNYKFQYKTDGAIDIYVNGFFTSAILATNTSGSTGETFPVSISEIVEVLNGSGPDSGGDYSIFGMKVHEPTLSRIITVTNNRIFNLVGVGYWTNSVNLTTIKGTVRDFSILRLLKTLAGTSIHQHYNYTIGGFNVQKPAVSQIKEMIEEYKIECRSWMKQLLVRGTVKAQTGLSLSIINEDPNSSGIQYIDYDVPNL